MTEGAGCSGGIRAFPLSSFASALAAFQTFAPARTFSFSRPAFVGSFSVVRAPRWFALTLLVVELASFLVETSIDSMGVINTLGDADGCGAVALPGFP